MDTTKEQFARLLNGRQMGEEITDEEEQLAKMFGRVLLFGYSDDNAEFRGGINDEIGCYNGGILFVHRGGVLADHEHECDCEYCGFKTLKAQCIQIEAKWDCNGYSWMYATEIPHACFDVMDCAEKFCRGIVFDVESLPVVNSDAISVQ